MGEQRAYRVARWGEFLATRESGRKVFADVQSGHSYVLDFTDVQAITGAFADELVCGLIVAGHQVGVVGESRGVHEVLVRAIGRRGAVAQVTFDPYRDYDDWPGATGEDGTDADRHLAHRPQDPRVWILPMSQHDRTGSAVPPPRGVPRRRGPRGRHPAVGHRGVRGMCRCPRRATDRRGRDTEWLR